MRRRMIVVLLLVLFAVLLFVVLRFATMRSSSISVDISQLTTHMQNMYTSNQYQSESPVWLGVYQNQLYFYMQTQHSSSRTTYDRWLCVITDAGIEKLCKIGSGNGIHIIGQARNFLYYWKETSDVDIKQLYGFNLLQKQNALICNADISVSATAIFSNDGAVYVPLSVQPDQESAESLLIKNGELIMQTNQVPGFQMRDRVYNYDRAYGNMVEDIIATDVNGEETPVTLEYGQYRVLLPSSHGILVHNAGKSSLLYLIDPSHEIKLLFEVTCMSSCSAVAVVGDDVFLSLKRYEAYADIGMTRFENDTIEGTYRINLVDGSTTKLSNRIYSGLYCFDSNTLFAVDEFGSVFLIDTQGRVLNAVLNVK